MKALSVHLGPRAAKHVRENGLRPHDVRVIAGAAGGPKGLALNPLDRFLFGEWLPTTSHTIHLVGASIGAWRMAVGCFDRPAEAFARLADEYIGQDYETVPGRRPPPSHVSRVFRESLHQQFDGREAEVLNHPRFRLHVFTSRGLHLLGREGRLRTPLGYLGAFATNLVSRPAMGGWLERVVFSDPRDPIPLQLSDYRSRTVPLDAANLQPGILASCSIPFWLDAVHQIPGAPPGAYWDGGITDYHLHLDYASMTEGLALYPHFQQNLVPGWLDKTLRHRHRATPRLDNVVVLAPDPAWVATLPRGKLPDRGDFTRFGGDDETRRTHWRREMAECQRLSDEFQTWLQDPH